MLGSKPTLKVPQLPHGEPYLLSDRSQINEALVVDLPRPLQWSRSWVGSNKQSQVSELVNGGTEVEGGNRGRSSSRRFIGRLVGWRRPDEYKPVSLTSEPVKASPVETTWTSSTVGGLAHIPEAGESRPEVCESQNQPVVIPQTPLQDLSEMDEPTGLRSRLR